QAPAFTAATLARQDFVLAEGQSLDFEIAATAPGGQPVRLTVGSELLDQPGGTAASFAGQAAGSVSVTGAGTAAGTFHLRAGCAVARPQPYYVLATAAIEGCNTRNAATAFRVTITRPGFAAALTGDTDVCNRGEGTYTVRGPAFAAYHWVVQGGQVLGSATGPTVRVQWGEGGAGTVAVSGVLPTGCYTEPVALAVAVRPGLPITGPATYCNAEHTALRYSVSGPAAAYQWSISPGTIISGQGTNAVQVDVPDGAFATLQVSNGQSGQCATFLTIAPDSACLAFYNVVTANGDGRNDYFTIRNLRQYPGTTLAVFNRWGRKLYESADYRNDYGGENTSAGLYYYYCRLADGRTYRGWFELIK
ncbi:MAG: gliding motility-associated C-terminal domain-containing protein, partial [Hymenobacter sp.]